MIGSCPRKRFCLRDIGRPKFLRTHFSTDPKATRRIFAHLKMNFVLKLLLFLATLLPGPTYAKEIIVRASGGNILGTIEDARRLIPNSTHNHGTRECSEPHQPSQHRFVGGRKYQDDRQHTDHGKMRKLERRVEPKPDENTHD